MYIALADSSVGDRKQMERLLERESDRRVNTTGVFYIETFGSTEALLKSPTIYDVYFLDVTDPGADSYDIAKLIRNKGILSPIVFCISEVDYRNRGEELSGSMFMDKPIKVAELTSVIDEILDKKKREHVPTIEFRDSKESFYLGEKDIVYMQGEGYNISIHMTDGSVREANGFIDNVWKNLVSFDCFFPVNKKTIVNCASVKEISGLHVILHDGTKIPINMMHRKTIVDSLNKYLRS